MVSLLSACPLTGISQVTKGDCSGLNCGLHIPLLKSQHPGPQNVTVFGDWLFKEVDEVTGVGPSLI